MLSHYVARAQASDGIPCVLAAWPAARRDPVQCHADL